MGPFDAATVRRFVTLGQWKAAARKAKDVPTAEIASGVTLGEAVIVLPGRINARKGASLDQRTADFVLSGSERDRDGDQVNSAGWVLQNYRKNPVILFGHDYYNLPIGRSRSIGLDGDELVATGEFASADLYTFADTVFRMILGKWLNAASVGFQPLQWLWNDEQRGYDFAKQELYEWSVVPVPSYPDALQRAADSGIDLTPLKGWAEATLDKIAGLPGLWLPRAEVEGMLKSLTGNPVLVQITKAIPAFAALGKDGANEDEPIEAEDPDPTGTDATAGAVCPQCGAVNATGNETCTDCGKPMKGANLAVVKDGEQLRLVFTPKGEGDAPSVAPPNAGGWVCSCGVTNDATAEKCTGCEAAKPRAAPAAIAKDPVNSGGKPCPTCGAMNPMDAERCAVCGNPMQLTPQAPTPDMMDTTNHAMTAAVAKALEPVVAGLKTVTDRLGALEGKTVPPAPAPTQEQKDAAAVDQLLSEINAAPAPAVDELDVTADEVRAAVRAAVEEATAAATKARQTAVTGRLVDD